MTERAGLTVEDLRVARCRMEFHDIGAVVWILRKCDWWIPDFSVDTYAEKLRELDRHLRSGSPFIAHVFPLECYPFPTQEVCARWLVVLRDPSVRVGVSEDPDGLTDEDELRLRSLLA